MHIYFCGIGTLSSFQVAELYKVITKCNNAPLYTDFKKMSKLKETENIFLFLTVWISYKNPL